jgi:hypothetical protein
MKNLFCPVFIYILSLLSVRAVEVTKQVQFVELEPPAECSAPIRDSCDFYLQCLEDRNYDCGITGYPLGYGQLYCQKFVSAAKPHLSAAGQTWMSNTMLCLQKALVPEATGAPNAVNGCDALKDKAFGTHAKCYVDNGLCFLPPTDWLVILRTLGFKTMFASLDAVKATFGASGECAYSLVTSGLRKLKW